MKERQEFANQGMTYGIRRMDLMIVGISGAGIYVCLELIKYLDGKCLEPHWLINVTGFVLLLTLVQNFTSQFTGYRANKNDFLRCQFHIDAKEEGRELEDWEDDWVKHYLKMLNRYSKATGILNLTSTITMFIGLFSLMTYFLFIF